MHRSMEANLLPRRSSDGDAVMASNTPNTGDQFRPPRWAQIIVYALSVVKSLVDLAAGVTRWF